MESRQAQCIDLKLNNTPAALPRLLLVFSRRRIRVSELAFVDSDGPAPAGIRMVFDFAGDGSFGSGPGGLESLLWQLRRLVDVVSVEVTTGATAGGRVAA